MPETAGSAMEVPLATAGPFGVTLRQVLEDCGAERVQAVQVSGPSGTCVDEDEFDRRIAFEDLPTAGAFTIFGPERDLFEVAPALTQEFKKLLEK